jgi:hypothetical protein
VVANEVSPRSEDSTHLAETRDFVTTGLADVLEDADRGYGVE